MIIEILKDGDKYRFIVKKEDKPVYMGWKNTEEEAKKIAEKFVEKNDI